jgi:hypothetical protein
MKKSKCPICKTVTKPVTNIGYYNTHITIEGRKLDDEEDETILDEDAPKDKFSTFEEG